MVKNSCAAVLCPPPDQHLVCQVRECNTSWNGKYMLLVNTVQAAIIFPQKFEMLKVRKNVPAVSTCGKPVGTIGPSFSYHYNITFVSNSQLYIHLLVFPGDSCFSLPSSSSNSTTIRPISDNLFPF